MFILKKVLSPFILPPGIFVLILLFTGFRFILKRYLKVGLVNLLLGMLLWLSSISPVSDAMFRGLEGGVKIPENPQGDVIILLGGGIYDGSPDISGIGVPSDGMMGRIVTAVRLQKKLNLPVIVSGGRVYKHINSAEAVIGKRFLIDLGVPPNKVIIEDKSRDTFENALYSREILERHNYKRPIIVTSAFHMRRAVISFEKVGIDVTPFPAMFKTWEDKDYGWVDYLPNSMEDTKTALHEYLGLLYYTLKPSKG